MELFHIVSGQPALLIEADAPLPESGLIWADFKHEEAQGWECWAEPLVGAAIDAEHVADSLNPTHPSFFDGTAEYDMLVFEGLGPSDDPVPLETRNSAFFLFDRILITVRASDSVSIEKVRKRLLEGRYRGAETTLSLAHLMIDTMVDRFLKIREPMDRHYTQMQDDLLDPRVPVSDWRALLDGRRETRRLEALSETQLEALDTWHRESRFEWQQMDEVRYRDLVDHVGRVLAHASGQERDLEAAVQLHFAATAHRTNKVMQALTVLSAIFFPLTFVVGIYGMNFDNMPELHWRYGYFAVLALLAIIAGSLVIYFRRKRLL